MPRRHASPQHERYESVRPCERKRRFKNEAEALNVIETAELMDMSVNLIAYDCPYCDGWHLSSVKDGGIPKKQR